MARSALIFFFTSRALPSSQVRRQRELKRKAAELEEKRKQLEERRKARVRGFQTLWFYLGAAVPVRFAPTPYRWSRPQCPS